MKSIVEEASSIAKAIENGWIRAGKPQEFTVRIFEEPEKNFLGFSKKPAKVGLFYKEIPAPAIKKDSKRQQQRPQQTQRPFADRRQQQKPQQPQQMSLISKPQGQQVPQQRPVEQQKQPKWSPQLVDGSKEWIQTMLKTIDKDSTSFAIEQKQYFLTIRFAHPIFNDSRKEQFLFKNWSHLLLQALRHRFKRGLRGYKIIITSAA